MSWWDAVIDFGSDVVDFAVDNPTITGAVVGGLADGLEGAAIGAGLGYAAGNLYGASGAWEPPDVGSFFEERPNIRGLPRAAGAVQVTRSVAQTGTDSRAFQAVGEAANYRACDRGVVHSEVNDVATKINNSIPPAHVILPRRRRCSDAAGCRRTRVLWPERHARG